MKYCRNCEAWFEETAQAQPYRDGASPFNTDRSETPELCPLCGSEDWSEAQESWRCIDLNGEIAEEFDDWEEAEDYMDSDPEIVRIDYVIVLDDGEEIVQCW